MGKTKDANHQELMEVINSFDFGGELEEVGIFGNGHINETYCAVFSTEAGQKRYILQKMNKQIFKDPVGPVSYTHLDVYKRQMSQKEMTIEEYSKYFDQFDPVD